MKSFYKNLARIFVFLAILGSQKTNAQCTFNLPDSIFGCGDSVLVSADIGYSSYAWNGGGSTRTKWIKAAGRATCTVTGGACGVTQVDSVFVNIITNKIVQNDTAICAGVSKQLSVVSNSFALTNQGSICGTADEGFLLTLTAPSGSKFTSINFASYGTPSGTCGNYTISGCHAINSVQIAQAACIGNSTCTISADNGVFGDPCGGTYKRLYIQATYGSNVNNVGKVLWSNGDTNSTITVTPATSTTYYCTSTLNGRTCTDSVRITVNAKPAATITPSGTASICSGDSALLSANTGTGLTYKWLLNNVVISGAVSANYKTITSGSYRVLITNATGCSDTSVATVVSVATKPTATATAATTTTLCTGGSVVVNANTGTGLTYQWLNNNAPIATATNASYTATAAGSYRVLVSNASGCRDTSTAVAVIVNTIPTITASTPANRCGTGTVALGATASAGTINWYSALTGGTSLATGASFTTPSIAATTTYYVDATANGCTTAARTAVVATVNTIPTITASTPASRCGTGTVALGATASAGTINWYSALTGGTSLATGASFTTPSIAATTTYYVDATANGCTTAARTSVAATVNAIPTATATAATTTTLCTGGSVVVNANTGTGLTYQWLNNNAPIATATNASYTATAAGSYRVLVSNASGCSDTSTAVAVIVNTIPTITASTPAAICGTGTVALGATASAGTINWYSALTGGTSLATGASFTTPSIAATTTYFVDATANGCTTAARTAVVATVNAIPTITASTPASRCGTGTVALGATASAGTINWYSALTGGTSIATGASFTTPSIAATTTYFVDATANGCTTAARTSVAATVNTIPTITASTPATICGTGTAVLGATASAGTINWYSALTGGTSLATGASFTTPSIAATTTYYVDATANGCTTAARTAVVATVNAIPTITASTPASRCGTGTVALGATASAGTINWYSALTGGTSLATGASFTTPSIAATTTYFVDATANGCTTAARTSVAATVNAIPTATATAATTTTLCTGGSVVVNANTGTGLTYQWLNNNAPIATATNASYTATAAGSYRVLVSNASGCRDTSTAVAVIVNTIPTITASTPAAICGTGTVALGATASAGTINWYSALTGGTSLATGASFTTPSIAATTTYYVDATANGCTTAARTAVVATVNAIPTITASTPASRCGTGTVALGATASAGTINWYAGATGGTSVSTGASFTTPSIAATTNYFVDATANGCTTATRTSVTATVNPNLTASVSVSSNTTSICGSAPITFTATPTNGGLLPTYQWKRNGVNVGTGTNTYVLSGALNADSVYAVMTSNASPCLVNVTSNSNGIVLTSSTVTPTVAISANPGTTICNGTSVTFTANATNGGSSPSYQWRRNGLNVGTNLPTFTSATLVTNDSISVVLTSNATCISTPNATSAASVMTVNAVPTITASTPANRCGTGTVALGATSSAGTINWYTALTGGTSIATGASFTTPSIAATTTYFVDATANGCTTAARTSVAATVNTIPTITASTPASRCGTGTVALGATASAGTINWYTALTGGTSIATGASFTTPSIAATTTYFVDATANGCTTAARTSVAATVNAIPTATATAATTTTLCTGGSVVVNANTGTGLTYQWLNNNAPIATATNASYTATAAGSYRVLVSNASGCSDTSTAVAVIVNAIPTITASTPASRCGTGTVALGATASAGTINWYSALTGGTSLATGASFTTPSIAATTTYFVDATANGCTTAARTSVAATVNAKPITSAISGRTSVHSDTVETYAVTNTTGSSYVWTIAGGVKLTGGTTNSITVDWDVIYTSGMVKVIETNTIGCKGDTVYKPIVSIVPVEFLSFDAKRVNEKVNLTWVTASEINNSHFEVERSLDNNRFEQIGTVKGNGTTSMMNTYRMVDNIKTLINSNATTVYYRLKQVDYDGEFAYTSTVTVSINEKGSATAVLNPNPFKDAFTIEVTESAATTAEVYLLDGNGKMVRNFSMELNKGTTAYQLTELNELSSGIYFVRIITASGNSYTIKTIKK